ncbi:MAG: hypothetical protein R3B06_27940 [Kofleriaceae bacterium]
MGFDRRTADDDVHAHTLARREPAPGKRTRSGDLPGSGGPSVAGNLAAIDAHTPATHAPAGLPADPFEPHAGTAHGAEQADAIAGALANLRRLRSAAVPGFAAARDAVEADAAAQLAAVIVGQIAHAAALHARLADQLEATATTPIDPTDRARLAPIWGVLGMELPLCLTASIAELAPVRFGGRPVMSGAAAPELSKDHQLTTARLKAEADGTIKTLQLVVQIRDQYVAAAGMLTEDARDAIGARLASLAARPAHFALARAALTALGIWADVSTARAARADAKAAPTFADLVDDAAQPRTVDDVSRGADLQGRLLGPMVDVGDFDQAAAIDRLQADTWITYLDDSKTKPSRASHNARAVLATLAPLAPDARAAVLEHFRRANVLDLFAGGLPWAAVEELSHSMPSGHRDVRAALRPYYEDRSKPTDSSIGGALERVPLVGGALESVGNFATGGFLHEHDRAYRAERQGQVTGEEYADTTAKTAARSMAVTIASGAAGEVGAGLGNAAFGRFATRGVVGRVLSFTATGALAGGFGGLGGRAGADAIDGELSSFDAYLHDAGVGAALGGVLGGGLAVTGEAARFIPPAARARLASFFEKFPGLSTESAISQAAEQLAARASQGVVRVVTTATDILEAVRLRAATLSDDARRFFDDLGGGGFGGPPLAPAGAYHTAPPLGRVSRQRQVIADIVATQPLHLPGDLDGPAVSVIHAERLDPLADDLASKPAPNRQDSAVPARERAAAETEATASQSDDRPRADQDTTAAAGPVELRARIIQAIGDVPISSAPATSANGRPSYFIERADGAELKRLVAQLPDVRVTEFPRGLTIHHDGSDWFLEWMPEKGAPGHARATSSDRGHVGLPPANTSIVLFYGFRGVQFVDGVYWKKLPPDKLYGVRRELERNPLLHYGHVGVSFDGGHTIHGLTPSSAGMTADELLKKVLNHEPVPAIVQDDTATFRRARELAAEGWDLEVSTAALSMDDATRTAAFGENARLEAASSAKEPTGKDYQFPYDELSEQGSHYANDQSRNCATYPQMLGLCVPEPSGQLRDYIPKLKEWSTKSPVDNFDEKRTP